MRQRAEQTAGQLEQIFVHHLVKGLRDTLPKGENGGMFGAGPGAGTYEDWFDVHMSEQLTRAGSNGIGIAESLLRTWERDGVIPSADAAAERPRGIDVRA
ncbi:MAG: rod-binding protein [Planctomycetota bacterium]